MKSINLERAFSRAGFCITIKTTYSGCPSSGYVLLKSFYKTGNATHVCSWYVYEGEVRCLYVKNRNSKDCILSDSYTGSFPKTIKDAVKWTQGG